MDTQLPYLARNNPFSAHDPQAPDQASTDQTLLTSAFRSIALELIKQDVLVSVEHDFSIREAQMGEAEGWTDRGVPIFDHARNTLNQRNSLWLKIRQRGSDDIVATSAARIYRNSSIPALFLNNRVFYDGTKLPGEHRVWLENPAADHVRGNLAFLGGGWVRKDFRHRRIAGLMVAFMEAMLLQNYELDYSFAIIHHHAAETGLGIHSYHFNNLHSGIKIDWPGRGLMDMWLLYNHRSDIMRQLTQHIST